MKSLRLPLERLLLAAWVALFLLTAAPAQQPQTQPPPDPPQAAPAPNDEEVVRVTSELVQTGVTVFDKQGRFVNGLKLEDFVLQVDGKPQAVAFFDRVTTGGPEEAARLARAAGTPPARAPSARGRVLMFFVDDLHLSFEAHKRTRDLLARFVERDLRPDDVAVVASTSGKIGFLQQFTDDPVVLRAAAARLVYNRDYSATDRERPPMSEYEALLIDRRDPTTTKRFVAETMAQGLALSADSAEATVRMRARSVLQQAASYTAATLRTFESFMRNSAQMPGLKVTFFISDGFYLDTNNSDVIVRLQRITDAAARSGVVIYTLHSRGLEAPFGAEDDLSSSRLSDKFSEGLAQQDPLNALAVDTGGRLIKNTNDFTAGIRKALDETSSYYLLAWRPEAESQREGKFRSVKVSVRGRPELTVRLQKGFFDGRPKLLAKPAESPVAAADPAEEQLRAAVASLYPRRALPTALAVNYVDTGAGGPSVAASLQIESDAVEFTPDAAGGKATALVDVAGAVFNADGKQEDGFRTRLTVTASDAARDPARRPDILYHYTPRLRPGLYQVRVAARDTKSGLVGSSSQWLEVPDLSARRLALSSLLVGERTPDARTVRAGAQAGDESPFAAAPLSVDRRFARTSALRYLVYVYNSAGPTPDVTLQTRVLRGEQVLLSTEPRKVAAEGQDPARLAYAADIPLNTLSPGRYVLHVNVSDRAAKKTAERRVTFEVR